MSKSRAPITTPAPVSAPAQSPVPGLEGQDLLGNAALASAIGGAQPQQEASTRTDITKLTPEYVAAHRADYGIPAEAPIEDFFYEFIAKRLATQDMSKLDPNDPSISEDERQRILADQQLLNSWGYQSTVSADQEVVDPETGLYAVRFDPLEGEAGKDRKSVLAFRGTEAVTKDQSSWSDPLGIFNDIVADSASAVGANQYEANAEAIRALMEAGTDETVLTGHSLGGYLAQRVAAENADHTDSVVTFQAGGIDERHADAFEKANADGHIDVRHHQTSNDIVHRAGEDRLDGTFFDHVAKDGVFAHALPLMYDDRDTTSLAEAGHGKTVTTYDHDPVNSAERHLLEAGRTGLGGLARVLSSPFVGAWSGLDEGLGTLGDGLGQLGSAGENLLEGGWDLAKDLGGKALDGLGTLGSGLSKGAGKVIDVLSGW